jgi:hypothetical protein
LAIEAVGTGAARPVPRSASWLADPRSAVLIVLGLIVVVGIGRNALRGLRSRRALERLSRGDVTAAEVTAAAASGRAALPELARLRETGRDAIVRDASAQALLMLWGGDQLVAEEEKAVAGRLYEVRWQARRRYPRDLRRSIPVVVKFGLAGVSAEAPIRPQDLQWSYRIVGTQRAALETFSAWEPGVNRIDFAIEPMDYPTNGPHRLVLEARARTDTPSSTWELNLPLSALSFEFDPRLAPESICCAPDEERGRMIAAAVRLAPSIETVGSFQPLNESFALRDPPVILVESPLPCDLAHHVRIEFEGIEESCLTRTIVLPGQPLAGGTPPVRKVFPLASLGGLSATAFDGPRPVRYRAVLEPDPELAWADPDIRSLWPGIIVTEWCEGRVVRL